MPSPPPTVDRRGQPGHRRIGHRPPPEGTADDVNMAVDAAVAAFPGWATTPPRRRADVMRRLADGLKKRTRGARGTTITPEMGAPIAFSRQAQVGFRSRPPWPRSPRSSSSRTETVENSLVVREPIGVVGAITPWNFPLQQLVTKVVPALLAGQHRRSSSPRRCRAAERPDLRGDRHRGRAAERCAQRGAAEPARSSVRRCPRTRRST